MKISTTLCLALGFISWGMNGCSSTSTETADSAVTTEAITPEMATADTSTTRSAMSSDTAGTMGTASGTLSEDPTNFVLLAGSLDLLQTRSSNQAISKATNPEVRSFAQTVIADHSSILRELRGIATTKKLKYPTDMLPKHQLLLNRLSEEKAKDFDKTYMEIQEAAHDELEELFEDASKRHADPEMKAFAMKSLPTMRTQLESSKKIKDKVD